MKAKVPKLRVAAAAAVLLASATTIGAALVFEALGYAPCELCLLQRWPYYAGVPLAALTLFLARTGRDFAARAGLAALAALFFASAVFGAYHAGVEWGFWPGPAACSGDFAPPPSVTDFFAQLDATKVVRCDAPALRILGLSLAGWNALVSAGLAGLASSAAMRKGA